jgi:hypothetical protein
MNLREEIARQKKLMDIEESPHNVQNREFGHLTYSDSDTLVFGYYTKDIQLYVAPLTTHGRGTAEFYIENRKDKGYPLTNPKYDPKLLESPAAFNYHTDKPRGRIWMDSKLLTFWKYPNSQAELNKIVLQIFRESDVVRQFYPLQHFELKYVEIPKRMDTFNWEWDTSFSLYQPHTIINIESYGKALNPKQK